MPDPLKPAADEGHDEGQEGEGRGEAEAASPSDKPPRRFDYLPPQPVSDEEKEIRCFLGCLIPFLVIISGYAMIKFIASWAKP
jgi:hypothetical protein